MRILLAEDNPNNRALAGKQLRQLGHTSTAAENGAEVLELLRSDGPFDCILMDVHMPVMDGIETALRIREEFEDGPGRPPIIAVTANVLRSNRDACLAAGMAGVLTKPLCLSVLQEALDGLGRVALDEARARRPVPGECDIEFEHFDSIMDGGDEEAVGIFDDFCQWTTEGFDRMQQLAGEGEIDAFVQLAHRMRGSLATFGFAGLSRQIGALEAAAESGSLPDLDGGWASGLHAGFSAAAESLRARI